MQHVPLSKTRTRNIKIAAAISSIALALAMIMSGNATTGLVMLADALAPQGVTATVAGTAEVVDAQAPTTDADGE